MIWLFLDDVTLYLNDEIRNIYYEFMASVHGTQPKEYYEDCGDLVHYKLHSAVARFYEDAYFKPEAKSQASSSFNSFNCIF